MSLLLRVLAIVALLYLVLAGGTACMQRSLIYFPTHQESQAFARENGLTAWLHEGELIGYCRAAPHPRSIWLFLHGNGGQAAGRGYALPHFDVHDSVYILEYPGYGERPGKPSRASFNEAAERAYRILRAACPGLDVKVLGESLGSGPACHLAGLPDGPTRLVLLVPFNRLVDVAQERIPFLPAGAILLDRWDNIEALSRFHGTVDIYGATRDSVIPVHHARRLARSVPAARYHEIDGLHNDWRVWSAVDLSH